MKQLAIKYYIKTSNHEGRRIQMQGFKSAVEMKRSAIKTIMYTDSYKKKPHGNCKPKTYNRYTHKKEKRIQT